MKNQFSGAVLMGLLVLSPFALQAQNSNQHMDQGASKMMKSADVHFMMKAAQGGMAEVKMGQLAAEKASNPDVKAFGQKMVDDHTKAAKIRSAGRGSHPTHLCQRQGSGYL